MKKTLVALSVLAAASAQAGINLYDAEGVTVDFGGDIEVVYKNSYTKDSDFKQEIQDADFSFDTRYAINDSLSIGGFWEFSGDKDKADTGDVYVALYTENMGTLKVGKTATIFDDAGIGNDYQFGVSKAFDDATVAGKETIKYQWDNGTVYFGAAFTDNQDKPTSLGLEKDDSGNIVMSEISGRENRTADANLGVRFSGFDAVVFYGETKEAGASKSHDLLALELRYGGFENINLEAGYYDFEDQASSWAIAADYTYNAWSFAAGFSSVEVDKKADASKPQTDAWFLNAGYGIAPNTTVYAEISDQDKDNVSTDFAYAIGVKAEF